MIWFGWVLWHINHCRLFNAKSSLYICIKYIGFGLVRFYGISIIGGSRGVIVIFVGIGHGDTSSKSWTRLIAFHIALIPLGKV